MTQSTLGCFSLVFFFVVLIEFEVQKVVKDMSKGRVYNLLQEIKETEQTVAIICS